MSTITYNGITLTHLNTRSIEFEPVLSDDGMDTLYTKVTFDVSAILSPPLSPTVGGQNATLTLARVEHYLNQKRAAFEYSVGGQALVTWLGGPDAKNGPHPRGVKARRVDGTEVIHVDFGIELNISTCPADPRVPYVSHRWTESVDIDDTARTVKTRRGRIVVRGDMRTSPDALRGLVMPPIDSGFLREESHYELQSDGLALDYSYRDREQYLMPPAPSWKAEGSYVESTADGAKRFGEVRVRLTGAKTVDLGELLKTAILVATTKLDAAAIQRGSDRTYVAIGGIQQSLWEPEVSVTVKALLQAYQGRVGGLPINLRRFTDFPLGSQPGQNPATLPDPGTRGTAGLTLVAAALNDPCLTQAVLRTGGSSPTGPSILKGQGAAPLAQVTTRAVLPDDFRATYKTGQGEAGVWSDYKVHIRTIQDRNVIQVPVGKADADPVIIQLAGGSQVRIVRWRAEKVGAEPDLPDPDMGDNFVLKKATIDKHEVTPFGSGTDLKYRVEGRYVYFVKRYTTAVMTAGKPPWLSNSAVSDVLKAVTRFAKGIIDLHLGGYGVAWTRDGKVTVRQTNLPP